MKVKLNLGQHRGLGINPNQDRIDEIKELISYCEEGDIQLEELYNELDELTMDD